MTKPENVIALNASLWLTTAAQGIHFLAAVLSDHPALPTPMDKEMFDILGELRKLHVRALQLQSEANKLWEER